MPAEIYDKMYVVTGKPLDDPDFAHGLTMSRTGRVRAKKQHVKMESYIQTETDYENEEQLNCQRKANTLSTDSRMLPRTPDTRGEIVTPYQMKIIPNAVEKRKKDITKDRGKKTPNSESIMNGIKPSVYPDMIERPKTTLTRSSSIGKKHQSNHFNRTEQNFKTMTLNRLPIKRNNDERKHFLSPTRKSPGSRFTGILSPRKDKSSNSKFFLDVNGNDANRKGNTMGKYKRNDRSPVSEDEFFRARSSTFSTNNRPSKPFRKVTKSETDEYGKIDFTLQEMLKNKAAMQAFRDFLKSEFSEENLDFWLDCELYKSLKESKRIKMAFTIFAQYLSRSAPREVNIDSDIRTRIEENLKNPDKDAFVEAQNCIYALMKSDTFKRFLKSDRYMTLQLTDPKLSSKKTLTRIKR